MEDLSKMPKARIIEEFTRNYPGTTFSHLKAKSKAYYSYINQSSLLLL